jgi:hypothetical protein
MLRRFRKCHLTFRKIANTSLSNSISRRRVHITKAEILRTKAANLWHAWHKWHAKMFPWHGAFTTLNCFDSFCPTSVSILWNIVYIRFIATKLSTSCSRTSYKIVPVTKLDNYLHHDTSETEVNININVNKRGDNSSEKNTATSGRLIVAAYDFIVHLYIPCTCVSGRLVYNTLFVGVRGPEQPGIRRWIITGMGSIFGV